MAVVVEKYVDMFDRNFDEIKDDQFQQVEKDYPKFMRIENTQRAFVKKGSVTGLGLPVQSRDLSRLSYDEPIPGPIAYYSPVTYRLGYQIERQAVEDELWGLLANRPMNMLRGSQLIMDMAGANILNNGTSVQSYDMTEGDGVKRALFSAVHVREDGATTWTNRITTDTPITVETVFQAIVDLLYNLKDSRGFPIQYGGMINLYIPSVSSTLWRQAVEVQNSVMNPNTTNNRINALLKVFSINVVPLRFLTSPTAWFIGWQPGSDNYGLTMIIRTNPDITPLKPFNDNPDAWFSRLRQRFVPGYEHKRGIARIGA